MGLLRRCPEYPGGIFTCVLSAVSLLFQKCFYVIQGDISHRGYKADPCPKRGNARTQFWICSAKDMGSMPFDSLHNRTDTLIGRNFQKQVNVVRRNVNACQTVTFMPKKAALEQGRVADGHGGHPGADGRA